MHASEWTYTCMHVRCLRRGKPFCCQNTCALFLATQALGRGSSTHGGAVSEADGGRFAMGNTEEKLIISV